MQQRFSPELLQSLSSLPALGGYRNSTPVITVSGVELHVEDILKAAVVGGLPALMVSGTGDGKSTVAVAIDDGWFGGRGTILRGDSGDSPIKAFLRTDFRGLFRREADNDEALIEPTERLHYGFAFLDEINRQLVPAMQGELLQVLDGQINCRGKTYRLGTPNGFFAVIGAMNLGPGYVAASDLDEALRQRFPIVLDLDHYAANVNDLAQVRAVTPMRQSWLKEIEAAHSELRALGPTPTGLRLASSFVAHHLNRCALLGRPKRTLAQAMPRLCEQKGCAQMQRGCHHVDETPWRILLGLERVTLALQAVAAAKCRRLRNMTPAASIDGDCLDYLRTLAAFAWPASGVLLTKPGDERSVHDYAAEIVGHVTESFEHSKHAILAAVTGRRVSLSDLGPWEPVVNALLAAQALPPARVKAAS
jgi:hypothetical protein